MRRGTRESEGGHAPRGRTLRVTMLAFEGVQILDVMGPLEVFSRTSRWLKDTGRRRDDAYALEIVAPKKGLVRASSGLGFYADRRFDHASSGIDTLMVAGGVGVERYRQSAPILGWLRRQEAVVRRLASVCTGAFFLAEAGLLKGLRATTHWGACSRLARGYEGVKVESDPIFVREGKIYTSAGVTAGMDLALALVEEDFGSKVALAVARELVMYLKRPGGQSQFSAQLGVQLARKEPLRDLQAYILDHPQEDLSVETLARRVAMSPRNFARVFTREARMTPARFVNQVRVEMARRLLEESKADLKSVCSLSGLGTPESMRRAFLKVLGTPPSLYRERFNRGPRAEGERRGRRERRVGRSRPRGGKGLDKEA